jgi:hypothetical protein
MSLSNHPVQNRSIKNDHNEMISSSFRPGQVGRQQPRKIRLTVSLPSDLVDRLRDAVYWSPSLTLAWLIAQSVRTSLAEMEFVRQEPFPKRTNALRAGRPRLAGQTMSVSFPAKGSGIGAEPPPRTRILP